MSSSVSLTPPEGSDGADFLLTNTKYHDCIVIVGNHETDDIENIGVQSIHLIAHSPVLREMFERSKSEDFKIQVRDVSPATFKLMLRFVYGGKLPKMTAFEAAALALCADRFKIPRLTKKALKQLDPTSAKDVFPALICVVCIDFPELKTKVTKIIQQETDKLIGYPDFLELDEDCVIFILKQNTMNVSEPNIWHKVVLWGQHKAKKNPNTTVRKCLENILMYIRFLSFTSEEIIKHVLTTKILTPEEFMDLTLSVAENKPLTSAKLCNIKEKRNQPQNNKLSGKLNLLDASKPKETIKQLSVYTCRCALESKVAALDEEKEISNFDIKSINKSSIEIKSFTCKSRKRKFYNDMNIQSYTYSCQIYFVRSLKGIPVDKGMITVRGDIVVNEELIIPITLKNGKPFVILFNEVCSFMVKFSSPHPAHRRFYTLFSGRSKEEYNSTCDPISSSEIKLNYKDAFHVLKVDYTVLQDSQTN